MKKIIEWMKTHYLVSFFIFCAIFWVLLSPSENENSNQLDIPAQTDDVIDSSSAAVNSVQEVLASDYKDYFDSNGLNFKLKSKIIEEVWSDDIEVKRVQFFTSDDNKQLLLNTIFSIEWKEYASNSKHNIDTNEIEDFYYSEVK